VCDADAVTICTTSTGLYCNGQVCSLFPVCLHVLGAQQNTETCACGVRNCNAATPFCYAVASLCAKTPTSFVAYPVLTASTCANEAYAQVEDAGACTAAIAAAGLGSFAATKITSSLLAKGCIISDRKGRALDYFKFNAATTSHSSCTDSNACVCDSVASLKPCEMQDGSRAVTNNNCLCGQRTTAYGVGPSPALCKLGEYCYAAAGLCAAKGPVLVCNTRVRVVSVACLGCCFVVYVVFVVAD
jgi:hypothetical protein